MFGIGPQELFIIVALCLIVFGPKKLPGMTRDVGRVVGGARQAAEEFKSEIVLCDEVKEARRTVEELKGEVRHSIEEAELEVVGKGHVGEGYKRG
jgi:sec-independent protein translocase protein TatA